MIRRPYGAGRVIYLLLGCCTLARQSGTSAGRVTTGQDALYSSSYRPISSTGMGLKPSRAKARAPRRNPKLPRAASI